MNFFRLNKFTMKNSLSQNINQQNQNRNLELLTIKCSYNSINNLYNVNLVFSGSSALLLNSEEIDVMLDDQKNYWESKHFPKHKI